MGLRACTSSQKLRFSLTESRRELIGKSGKSLIATSDVSPLNGKIAGCRKAIMHYLAICRAFEDLLYSFLFHMLIDHFMLHLQL